MFLEASLANSVDQDQTAPVGAVLSGSTLIASILNTIRTFWTLYPGLDQTICRGYQQMTLVTKVLSSHFSFVSISFNGVAKNIGFYKITSTILF